MADDKPVVESFQLDHTKVKAPYVRYIDTEKRTERRRGVQL